MSLGKKRTIQSFFKSINNDDDSNNYCHLTIEQNTKQENVEHEIKRKKTYWHKICEFKDCETRPNFNYRGETKARFCSEHKLDGMFDIKHKRCEREDCEKHPFCNYRGETKARFCSEHKLDGMIDIKHKTCLSDWCDTHKNSNPYYEGYCMHCFKHLFPEKPIPQNYKNKERLVTEYILETFPDFSWNVDKRIPNGCSKRRPDLYLDLGYQVIIIEIDENQHKEYDCTCENRRLMELSLDVTHRPIVFLRFNPDAYYKKKHLNEKEKKKEEEEEEKELVSSCWNMDSTGVSKLKKSKRSEWADRLEILGQQIAYWTQPDQKVDRVVEVVQMFFDE